MGTKGRTSPFIQVDGSDAIGSHKPDIPFSGGFQEFFFKVAALLSVKLREFRRTESRHRGCPSGPHRSITSGMALAGMRNTADRGRRHIFDMSIDLSTVQFTLPFAAVPGNRSFETAALQVFNGISAKIIG